MKKFVIILSILVGSVACVWADGPEKTAAVPLKHHTILAGLVKVVSWADPAKGTKSEIVVLDAARKPVHILITSTTTLWDSEAKAIMPEKIIVRKKVNVIYITTLEGVNIAKSIKILK